MDIIVHYSRHFRALRGSMGCTERDVTACRPRARQVTEELGTAEQLAQLLAPRWPGLWAQEPPPEAGVTVDH
jgi:hypothetical protein